MSELQVSAEAEDTFVECRTFGCASCFGQQCLCGFSVRCGKDPAWAAHRCPLARTNQLWAILLFLVVVALVIAWRF
jgi:hypothetical protein